MYRFLLLAFVFALSGCVSNGPLTESNQAAPEQVAAHDHEHAQASAQQPAPEQGKTPGQTKDDGVAVYLLEYVSSPKQTLQPVIDGKVMYPTGTETSYLVLSPGKHTLTAFQKTVYHGKFAIKTNYPIGREFVVQKGQVTSLGVVALEVQSDKKFFTYWADQQDRILTDINADYPELLANGNKLIIADGHYMDDNDIFKYRSHLFQYGMIAAEKEHRKYVGGPFGVLAWLRWTFNTKRPYISLIKTNSMADMSNCTPYEYHLACLVGSNSVFIATRNEGKFYSLPPGHVWTNIESRHGAELLIYDNKMAVALSENGGRSWTINDQYVLSGGAKLTSGGVYHGHRGVYLYSLGSDHTILYIPNRSREVRKISLDWDAGSYGGLLETRKGLYVGPASVANNQSAIMFTDDHGKTWETLSVPDASCQAVTQERPGVLQVSCQHGTLQSTDAGRKWRPVQGES